MFQMPYVNRKDHQNIIDNPMNRWLQDEVDILDGNCCFHVDFLGSVEVSEPTNSKVCRESFAKLYQKYITGISHSNSIMLWITGHELRIVEKESKNLIFAHILENVMFCASVTDKPDQFFYTCRDPYNDRWLCHLFVVKHLSSDRLCKAIGFAFRVCLRRKSLREGFSTNTMKNSRSIG